MSTHRIGLIGAQISTSLSPLIHTAEARALGIDDYSYELLDLFDLGRSAEQAPQLLREAVRKGYTGFNITYPCKQTVLSGLDEVSPEARLLNAVNTVLVDNDGRLVGHNTDHTGFLTAFRRTLPDVPLGTVVQAGAGGAGAAVAHALAELGARRLLIADPDEQRARSVAAAVSAAHPGTDASAISSATAALSGADGFVNASPIGMEGHPGTPVDVAELVPEHWVADVVYRPARTALLEAASSRGCRTLDGLAFLLDQAADTFALLTGTTPDTIRMRTQLETTLSTRAALAS